MAEAAVVVGVGNRLRGDDGVGLEVARRLRARAGAGPGPGPGLTVCELEGEGLALLDLLEGARAAVIVDAVRSDAAPGTIHRFDVADRPLPAGLRSSTSTHAVGIGEAIELARALGRLPPRLVVYAVEGERFDTGAALSPRVARAVEVVADRVLAETRRLAIGRA